ncbi:MAG: pyridoxal-phosphate dependent enzyme, partial [Proteobacteria bacterium]|nr:pyridoxal-phosphate dependent enzyme [Pseudomonadota bacterium]
MIDISDVEDAAKRLSGVAVKTPLLENAELNRISGGTVLIKPECFQATGSFKIRGAYNLMSRLTREQLRRGVVAFSSGNHAQGVAAAARHLGTRATIVMPADAPRAKLENTRKLGAEVITYDRHKGDREAIAQEIAAERGAEIVPAFDHP